MTRIDEMSEEDMDRLMGAWRRDDDTFEIKEEDQKMRDVRRSGQLGLAAAMRAAMEFEAPDFSTTGGPSLGPHMKLKPEQRARKKQKRKAQKQARKKTRKNRKS